MKARSVPCDRCSCEVSLPSLRGMMRATVAAQFTPWACLLLCCALTALTAAAAPQTPDQAPSVEQQSRICMVIRTFWGHGGDTALQQKQGLRRMLSSLRQQSNPK